uniref:Uncharacterized protein n=1 Tax=Sphaerodactylus townsendi TaxID=933632 RepID=A0ACB8FT22_9SAUR
MAAAALEHLEPIPACKTGYVARQKPRLTLRKPRAQAKRRPSQQARLSSMLLKHTPSSPDSDGAQSSQQNSWRHCTLGKGRGAFSGQARAFLRSVYQAHTGAQWKKQTQARGQACDSSLPSDCRGLNSKAFLQLTSARRSPSQLPALQLAAPMRKGRGGSSSTPAFPCLALLRPSQSCGAKQSRRLTGKNGSRGGEPGGSSSPGDLALAGIV